MDLNTAIRFGQLVEAAEAVDPNNTTNAAGQTINIGFGGVSIAYKVITTIYANDLATDMNPARAQQIVSFGFILQDASNNIVVAVRGTNGIFEWIHDAEFLQVPCPFLATAGKTEDGFTDIYTSLRVDVNPASNSVVQKLAALAASQPIASLTICGHSLGGAVATLLALDTAANTVLKNPTVYTYASPRTGDPQFVSVYNNAVPNTFRIANRLDLVPKLPLPPLYEHVLGLFELVPVKLTPLPKLLVKPDLACEHHLTTYLFLLSSLAGGVILPLNPECTP